MQELDPATGKAKWTRKIPKGWQVARTYSVDPVVLYLTNEDKKQWNISTLKPTAVTAQVDIDESFAPECGWAILSRDLQGCQGVAADADTLYLPTEAKTGANEIVAINLATGKEKWRIKSPADERMHAAEDRRQRTSSRTSSRRTTRAARSCRSRHRRQLPHADEAAAEPGRAPRTSRTASTRRPSTTWTGASTSPRTRLTRQ